MHRRRLARSGTATLVLAVAASLMWPGGTAAAASTDVVINEFLYNPVSEVDGDEFLELTNVGAAPVDLSGWCFSGITLCFSAGTSIAAGGFVVVSPDAARTQATYGVTPAAIYTGSLKNSGEKLTLRDAGAEVIDTVTYADVDPWPVTPDGLGPSLELVDATLDNDDALNWAASTAASGHTAGRANSVRAAGLGPRITAVTAAPTIPTAGQSVTVSATIADVDSATVVYRTDFAAEQRVAMPSVGGDQFQVTLPGVAAGHLLRYRIEATNAGRTSRFPRVDDTIVYQGVVAAHGISSALPVLEWFIADADYNAITSNPTADIERRAVLAYDGVVIDNAIVNIRGAHSQTAPKVSWKFELPKSHTLAMPGYLVEPVDEFAMQADWSDRSHGRPLLAWDSYQTAGAINAQVFPVRTQKNGQFLGLYTYLDLFDGTWREREGYDADQFFKAETSAFTASRPIAVRFEKKNPPDTDFTPLQSFLNGIALSGDARRDYLLANAEIPQLINYAAVTAIIAHHDSSSKNFYFTKDPVTGRWSMLPWDLDHTYGSGCCSVSSTFVTPAEPGDKTNDLMVALLAVPEWRQMYFRRLKTLVDEILAPGRLEAVYDAKVGPAQATTVLDFAAWPYASGSTYASQRTALFNALNARRNVFAQDSRVPAAQSPAPAIVINEIQHSPAGGDNAEFVELYNPSATEAVDLSGWSLTGGLDLQIPPGTVILPRGRMTFVRDDVTFRSTHGGRVFVGGVFSGALADSGTLVLARRNGSTADTVSYGGAGWPTATGGPSLELLNPTADNDDPANWALSVAPGGTPGAPNQGGGGGGDTNAPNTTVTAPSAGATLASSAVTMTGTATDDVDMGRVDLRLQNTTTGTWLQPNGTFAATAAVVPGTLVNDNGATTGWQLAATLPNGAYTLTATAVDAAGNADATPATRMFTVTVGGADTVNPNGALTVPAVGQVFARGQVAMSGTATDNRDVARVAVAVRNTGTGQWLRPNGTFGAWTLLDATFTSDLGTSVVWSFVTPALPAGSYRVNVSVFDAAGNQDGTKATATFTVR